MSHVIGLIGRAGSGKSTAAEELKRMGFMRVRFSTPLKNMIRALFASAGLSSDEIERRIEGDLKETPDPLLGGKTPRHAMQTLGTEWGRDLITPTIWSNIWKAKARTFIDQGYRVVAEDVRFPTEADAISSLSEEALVAKTMLRFDRQAMSALTYHSSENIDAIRHDLSLPNDGTIEELNGAIRYIFGDVGEV